MALLKESNTLLSACFNLFLDKSNTSNECSFSKSSCVVSVNSLFDKFSVLNPPRSWNHFSLTSYNFNKKCYLKKLRTHYTWIEMYYWTCVISSNYSTNGKTASKFETSLNFRNSYQITIKANGDVYQSNCHIWHHNYFSGNFFYRKSKWTIGTIDASERGCNPETPSNFWNNPKDSTIGWHTHLS